MKKSFKDALNAGQIMAATLQNGEPFVCDGVQHYQATEDGFNLTINRFHAFGDVLRRHDELKLTGPQLDTYLSSIESMFRRCRAQANQDSEQVMDAASEGLLMIDRLRQRQNLGLNVEQVYEIASIFYITEDEEPGAVDWTLNRKKIDSWLKSDNAGAFYAFFLASPIGNYIPLTALSDQNILNFLKEDNIAEILDWTRVLLSLRAIGEKPEMMSIIESRRETLYGYNGLLSSLLSPTSTTVVPG